MPLQCATVVVPSNVPPTPPLPAPESVCQGIDYYDIAQFSFAQCQVYQTPFDLTNALVIACANTSDVSYVICT